jgi:hypothetical protein
MPSAHDAGAVLYNGLRVFEDRTSPRFTVNWPALASSILEDSGPVFDKSEVRGDLAGAERAGSAGKHCSSRARGDKTLPRASKQYAE